jgi:hypothetical protein
MQILVYGLLFLPMLKQGILSNFKRGKPFYNEARRKFNFKTVLAKAFNILQ